MTGASVQRAASLLPAIVLGVGLGGFIDGIVLHQILGWHQMMSNSVPPTTVDALRLNVWWDGVFHVGAWIATAAGVLLLWRAGLQNSILDARRFSGGLLTGFALFNLLEGVINHHLLQIHNVREVANPTPWNIGFLALSAVMLAVGLSLAKRPTRIAAGLPRSAAH